MGSLFTDTPMVTVEKSAAVQVREKHLLALKGLQRLGSNPGVSEQQALIISAQATVRNRLGMQFSERRFYESETGHYTGLARWLRGEANHSSEIEAGFAINVGG